MIDVVVLGDANPDLILRGDVVPRFGQIEQLLSAAELTLGGSAAITAHALARLGCDARLVGVVGADPFGDLVRSVLAGAGVDISAVHRSDAQPTGITVVLAGDGERAILTFPGAIAGLSVDTALTELERAGRDGARHLHVSSFYLQPALARGLSDVFARAHRMGLTTSLDTNYDPAGRWTGLEPVLPHLDLLLPNRAEACALAGALVGREIDDPVDAGRRLAARGPLVVVKDGAAGAFTVDPDGTVTSEPGRPAVAVDTTGAGDTFVSAFLQSRLNGLPPGVCLRRAVAAGALSVAAVGGVGGQPTGPDLDRDDADVRPTFAPVPNPPSEPEECS